MGVRTAIEVRVGGLPRSFWALFAGVAVNRVGGVVEPFLALYLAHRGLDVTTIGAVAALVGVGSLGGQIVGGVAADRLGRKQGLALGMVGAAVGFAGLGAADSVLALAAAGIWVGFFIDFYRPASAALVNDLLEGEARERAYGLLFWVINLGFATAAILAGLLAETGYGWLFAIDALTCVACAAIIWRWVPADTRPAGHAERAGGLIDVLRDRAMLLFCLVSVLQASAYFQAFTTLPLAMRADGLGPALFGAVIAVNGVVIVFGQPLLLPWLARSDRRKTLALGIGIIGLGFGVTGLTPTYLGYALPVVIWSVGEILVNTVGPGMVAALAPDHLRGRYQGVWGTSFSLALIIAPLGGAALLDAAGDRALWSVTAGLCLLAALAVTRIAPAGERAT
jgi:MFS family permease